MKRKLLKYFLISVIVLDLLLLSLLGLFEYATSKPLNNFSENSKTVFIESGSGLEEIAFTLKNEGVLNNPELFVLYAWKNKKSGSLKAGTYAIGPEMSIKDIVSVLSGGVSRDFVRITLPEGLNSFDIAKKLESEGVIKNKEEFLNISKLSTESASDIFNNEFLTNINGRSLEGFLFPDTYDIHINIASSEAIEKLLDTFEIKAWPTLNSEGRAQAKGFAPYEHLIIASLLEKEVQTEEDMKLVAGIIYNRLEIGMPLQIDATLAFLTGKSTEQLSNIDKEIDSPFNTYKNKGLPPAPIANPGLRAIRSAMDPTPSNYFYYLTGRDGTTHFAETLEEHNRNKQLYLR